MSKINVNPKVKEYFKFKGKLHTAAVFDALGVIPHEGQKKLIAAYESKIAPSEETVQRGLDLGITLDFEYEFDTLTVAAGRRGGKSYSISTIAASELMIPFAHVLVASYTLENCDIIFKQVLEFMQKLGVEMPTIRRKEKELVLLNGARLTVGSLENIESKLGNYVTLLILDEAKKFDKQLYEQVLVPMLADVSPYGRSVLISSPESGWLETYYNYGISKNPDFKKFWALNFPTADNPAIPRAWIENARRTLPPDVFAQEIEGKFTAGAGLVCPEFDKERNVKTLEHYPYFFEWMNSGEIVINSIDPGYSHYFASVHVMYVNEIDTFLVFGSYQKNKIVTEVHAESIKEFEKDFIGRESDVRYCDPAAAQTIADLANLDLYYNKAEKPLRETVNCLATLCWQTSGVTGEPRLIFLEDCEGVSELCRQVSVIKWKEDRANQTMEKSGNSTKPFQPDRDRGTDFDSFDALRYLLFSYTKDNGMGNAVMTMDFEGEPEEFDEFTRDMNNMGYFKC